MTVNAKYSEIYTSSGYIIFDYNDDRTHAIIKSDGTKTCVHEIEFNPSYKYLRIVKETGEYRVYINDSDTYYMIGLNDDAEVEIKDLSIDKLRIETENCADFRKLQYFLLR